MKKLLSIIVLCLLFSGNAHAEKSYLKNFNKFLSKNSKYLEDKIIGRTTSGTYSFNYKKNLSFGYISSSLSNEELSKMDLYIEVAKQKYQAILEITPLKDKQARFL